MEDDIILKSDFSNELAAAEVESLRRLARVLERYNADDERDFAMVIAAVLRQRFSGRELAETFKVSPGTISRWAAGLSCPPSHVRATYVAMIRDLLVGSVESISDRIREPSDCDTPFA
jgi:Trp operon repressor